MEDNSSINDEFAIKFADWVSINYDFYTTLHDEKMYVLKNGTWYMSYVSTKRLLEIFKTKIYKK